MDYLRKSPVALRKSLSKSRAIFKARTNDDEHIVVKFVEPIVLRRIDCLPKVALPHDYFLIRASVGSE